MKADITRESEVSVGGKRRKIVSATTLKPKPKPKPKTPDPAKREMSLRLSLTRDLGPTAHERMRFAFITAEIKVSPREEVPYATLLDIADGELRETLTRLGQIAVEMSKELNP